MAERELDRAIPSPRMLQGARSLAVWSEQEYTQPSDGFIANLAAEFTRLFRGLSRFNSPPPPYESVYVDGGALYGSSTSDVINRFRQFGLAVQDNEPPDHVAFELDFMAFLCEQERSCWETGGSGQQWLQEESSYLNEHLIRWVPEFCQKTREFDKTGFYHALADITEGWIRYDQVVINDLSMTASRSEENGAGLPAELDEELNEE
ncbi:MAG: molecular chaperone TorD family protein [Chloroflexi bacterium]|nr:molecular chaperone TorD family protein [Chloroflexota bacterium]